MRVRCQSIEKAVKRATEFVRQVLTFSKQQVLELVTADLNHVVEDFEKMMRRMVGENVEMRVSLQAGLPSAKLDVGQINQVLLNLVVNAREAMPAGGKVTIETSFARIADDEAILFAPDGKPGDYLILTVTDTGAGMDAAVREKIFDPFFTTKEQGTGLGLSVVYGIVKKHEGFIMVDSDKDHGAVFRIFLPAAGGARPEEAVTEASPVMGKETVLLIEDDGDLRNVVLDMLSTLGHKVYSAANGDQALALFGTKLHQLDLVIADMVMPGKGGVEVCEEMRRIKPDIACLFVSGYGLVQKGAVLPDGIGIGFIQKPFSADSLCRKIRELVDEAASKGACFRLRHGPEAAARPKLFFAANSREATRPVNIGVVNLSISRQGGESGGKRGTARNNSHQAAGPAPCREGTRPVPAGMGGRTGGCVLFTGRYDGRGRDGIAGRCRRQEKRR